MLILSLKRSYRSHFDIVKIARTRQNALMSTKAPYHHGDLRSALLEAGEDILEEKGFQGFTLRECARRAGVSHAAPQHHFENATGFLTAIAARGYERLHGMLQRRLKAAGGNLNAQFIATSDAYTAFAEQYPEHFRIMFRCDLINEEAPALRESASKTFATLTNVIRRQRGDAEITTEALRQEFSTESLMSDILIGWCFVHGYAHLHLEQQLGMIPDDLSKRVRQITAERLSVLIQQQSA